jgi:tetratricopeptide (TPR) repeat protein
VSIFARKMLLNLMKKRIVYYFIIFAIFLYFFLIFDTNFHGPDEPIYFAYTASIIEDGDLNVVNQVYSQSIVSYPYVDISKTYNLPDYHDYGGVIFWVPFYAYGKYMYNVVNKFNPKSLSIYGLGTLTRSAMSLSTVLFGFLTLLFAYLFCRIFFSNKISILSTLVIFLGTPFFYYVLFEGGNNHVVAALFSILSIWFCTYATNMKRLHWFMYGLFFSLCVAIRTDFWFQIFFIALLFATRYIFKQTTWKNGLYFILGFMPIFVLRAINTYIKYGSLHIEELFYFNSFLRYKTTYCFNGLFSSFRGIFYTSPVFYVCLSGLVLILINLLRKVNMSNTKENTQDIFLFVLSSYLVIKLFFIGRIFSPGGDALSGRLLFTEFPIFVLLFARAIQGQKKYFIYLISIVSACFVLWNLLIISEFITGLDWTYIGNLPRMITKIDSLGYIINELFLVKDLGVKMQLCAPLLLIFAVILFFVPRILKLIQYFLGDVRKKTAAIFLKLFFIVTTCSCIAYLIITLFNIHNNKINTDKLRTAGFFTNFRVIEVSPIKMTEHEEEEHLWSLFKMAGYYSLKGNVDMVNRIIRNKEEIFGKRDRGRIDSLPLKAYANLTASYSISGRYAKAIETYQKAISLYPHNLDAYIGLGEIYVIVGNYIKAKETFEKALQINPNSINACIGLVDIHSKSSNYLKAIEYINRALELSPNDIELYFKLGEIYNQNGNYDKAIEYLNKALQLNPNFIEPYRSLAELYSTKGDYLKAIEYLNKALQFNPNNPELYFSLGKIYNIIGDIAKASRQVSELKKRERDDLANELERTINKSD